MWCIVPSAAAPLGSLLHFRDFDLTISYQFLPLRGCTWHSWRPLHESVWQWYRSHVGQPRITILYKHNHIYIYTYIYILICDFSWNLSPCCDTFDLSADCLPSRSSTSGGRWKWVAIGLPNRCWSHSVFRENKVKLRVVIFWLNGVHLFYFSIWLLVWDHQPTCNWELHLQLVATNGGPFTLVAEPMIDHQIPMRKDEKTYDKPSDSYEKRWENLW